MLKNMQCIRRSGSKMIYVGSDHAGYRMKGEIKAFLKEKGFKVEDLGTGSEESVDYTDYAFAVAKKVAKKPEDRGILVCGTGLGVCMAANKVKGIRAAILYDEFSAKAAAEHNNANIACFGARTMKLGDVKKRLWLWLETPFSGEERHCRRIKKMESDLK